MIATMKKNIKLALLLTAAAFNNAGWKMDENGKIETKDGNPIWIDANGGESVLDGGTVGRLNGEARKLRERAEAAEAIAKQFEGLDPAKSREALELASKIDQKQLIDAGKVEEVRNQISQQFQKEIDERDKKVTQLQSTLDNTLISNLFKGSEFIRDRVAVPLDMFESTFKGNFKVENGAVVAYGRDGNPIMSKKKIGEIADPNEALELIVENYPQRDLILKANDGGGTGNNGGGGNRPGNRTIRRSDFEKLPPAQQGEAAAKQRSGELKIVDG
jgi:hypothetical protein